MAQKGDEPSVAKYTCGAIILAFIFYVLFFTDACG